MSELAPWEEYQNTTDSNESGPWSDYQSTMPENPVQETKPRSIFSKIGSVVSSINNSPGMSMNPVSLLGKVPAYASKVTDKMGEQLSTELARPQVRQSRVTIPGLVNKGEMFRQEMNPNLAAGLGTTLAMAPDLMMTAAAPINTAKTRAPEALNVIERMGAKGVNNAMGIQPRTITDMAGSKNPYDVGTKLGVKLVQEGAVGSSAGKSFENAARIKQQFGESVGSAIEKIRSTGVPTTIEAKGALQPFVDNWAKYSDSFLSGNKALAKPFEQVYGKLSEISQKANGQLGLDDIRSVMDEVGEAIYNAAEGSPKEAAYKKIYGVLAKTREDIVQNIANQVNDKQLAQNLLDANAGYSRYSQIMPDIRKAAAKDAVGGDGILSGGPLRAIGKSFKGPIAKAAVKDGGIFKNRARTPYGPVAEGENVVIKEMEKPKMNRNIIKFPVRKPVKSIFKKAG